jgi:dolichol-phosphate mannosyltransferase
MSSVAVPSELGQAAEATAAAIEVAPPPLLPPGPHLFVVPAYDEEENIPGLFRDLEARPELFTPGSRVIVVDDGSSDRTAELVESYRGPVPVSLIKMERNQGPGAAFRAGFAAALAECPGHALVVTLEADTTSDLDSLPIMLERARGGAELVLASVHGGGRMENVSRFRRVLSAGAGYTMRRLLGVGAQTVSSFFRVYRASLLRAAHEHYGEQLIQERGFACKAELLSKLGKLGARIEEVPVDLDASRRNGESKMRVLPTMLGYWRLVVREHLGRGSVAA